MNHRAFQSLFIRWKPFRHLQCERINRHQHRNGSFSFLFFFGVETPMLGDTRSKNLHFVSCVWQARTFWNDMEMRACGSANAIWHFAATHFAAVGNFFFFLFRLLLCRHWIESSVFVEPTLTERKAAMKNDSVEFLLFRLCEKTTQRPMPIFHVHFLRSIFIFALF